MHGRYGLKNSDLIDLLRSPKRKRLCIKFWRPNMNKLAFAISTVGAVVISSASLADLEVQFIEGAPKDRFVITNVSDCALIAGQFKIDFTTSNAGLIFDVTDSGAGVEVFQPFEVTAGVQNLVTQPSILDGDQRAILDISGLGMNESIAFTIDVDDTNGTRAITVADSEISGTAYSFSTGGNTYTVVVDAEAKVTLPTPDCDA